MVFRATQFGGEGAETVYRRIIDIASRYDDKYELENTFNLANDAGFYIDVPDDDYRDAEFKYGASQRYWLDPKDYMPPSWIR